MCGPGQVSEPLWALVFPSIKWEFLYYLPYKLKYVNICNTFRWCLILSECPINVTTIDIIH